MSIYTQWDPLEEVIVGNCPTRLPTSWVLPNDTRRNFDQILEETKEDLDHLSSLIASFGVRVHRPSITNFEQNITIDNFTMKNPAFPIVPRDQYWTYGNTIYQTYSSLSDRYLDSLNYIDIFTDLFNRGWNWISQPLPMLENLDDIVGYKKWVVEGPKVYGENYKSKILWHMATLFRCGDKIIANTKGPGTKLGLEWVKRNTEVDIVSNYNTCMNGWGHIDHGFYMINDDTVICSRENWVPVHLKNKKIINLENKFEEFSYIDFYSKTQNHTDKFNQDWLKEWLTEWTGYMQDLSWETNVLVIDPNNIVFAAEWPGIFEELAKHGINCHVSKQRHGGFWEAGINCLTLDLSRKGNQRKIL